MNRLLAFLAALMFAAVIMPLSAQRRVTPVTPREPGSTPQITTNLKQQVDSSRLVTTIDAHGNTVMVDTVTGLEFVDSTLLKAPPKMEYPLLHEVIAGVNVWDPIMRALGQKYGLGDVWAELSMHNRYFPFFAVGLGSINETPVDKNFTFKSPVAPYFKIGGSYNFFYNSNPDYRLQMGLRYGFTTYKWSALDVTVDEGYWGTPSTYSLKDIGNTAGYLEVTFGIKVKIAGNFSAGWTIVYHSILHESKSAYGNPMYIPGYGKRNGAISGNFSIMYTIPINKKTATEVKQSEEGLNGV
ncbi:DUF6048 family protein [Duncaniella muricolitica]|uniref:DUF6048 family protein n=1 Tax=Duncaniella muricolitica TaxID=2880704 RepID=UPI00244D9F0E|nr:DUF6048 family protein [Duncaniella muricolitica]